MESVVLVIHLILALAIIGLVLIQKSEGGGLGIGGGTAGGMTTAHGAKTSLSRLTAICAACFFVTSLVLGVLAGTHHVSGSILDQVSESPAAIEGTIDGQGIETEPAEESIPSVPVSE